MFGVRHNNINQYTFRCAEFLQQFIFIKSQMHNINFMLTPFTDPLGTIFILHSDHYKPTRHRILYMFTPLTAH